jgi:hypothetical protein
LWKLQEKPESTNYIVILRRVICAEEPVHFPALTYKPDVRRLENLEKTSVSKVHGSFAAPRMTKFIEISV